MLAPFPSIQCAPYLLFVFLPLYEYFSFTINVTTDNYDFGEGKRATLSVSPLPLPVVRSLFFCSSCFVGTEHNGDNNKSRLRVYLYRPFSQLLLTIFDQPIALSLPPLPPPS